MTIKTTGPNVHPAFRTAFRTEASSKTNLTKIFRPANLSARIRRQNAARSAKNACATTSRFLQGRKRTSGEDASAYRTYYIEKPPAAALLPRHRASSAGCRNRSPTGHRTATLPTKRCDRIEKQGPVAPRNRLCRQAAVPTASSAFEASSECPARCGKPADRPFPQRAFGENFPAGIGSRRMRRISIVFLTNFVTFVSKNWLTPTRTGLPPDIRYSFRRDSCPEELAYANANRATARHSLFFSTR